MASFKLSRHVFTRLWDVHAWVGVIGALVLYLMFVAGSITLFHEHLAQWEEPLAQSSTDDPRLQPRLERALARADAGDDLWLYPPADHGAPKLEYQRAGSEEWISAWIDRDGTLIPERERLTSFVYQLHFLRHDVTGDPLYYFAGLLSILLLLAIVTGVLIHLKELAAQFHQFRVHKSARVLWSDLHKVLGVMGLPFQILYAYTGAFIVLSPLLLTAFTGPVFGGDPKRAEEMMWGASELDGASPGPSREVLSVDDLLVHARRHLPELSPNWIHLRFHGRENGTFEASGLIGGAPHARASVALREMDGSLLRISRPENASDGAQRWIAGLHFAHFGGLPLRFLFFFLGLAGAATLLSGNLIWLARRSPTHSGVRLLARLTVGFGAGSIVAIAALFLVSRVFPLEWSGRGTAEELTFLGALAASIVWALWAKEEAALWWQCAALAGLLLLPVPVLAARWSSAGLFGTGPHLPSVAGVDTAILTASLALIGSAAALRRRFGAIDA